MDILTGILIPFIGTTAGSACVFFLRGELKPGVQKAFLGFASGVMVAASVWSLLIPAMEMSDGLGRLAFLPAVTGFLLGMAFLLFLDMVVPHLHMDTDQPEEHYAGSCSDLTEHTGRNGSWCGFCRYAGKK